MKLYQALEVMGNDHRKIFVADETISSFKDEIFFVTNSNMYDEPLRDEIKYTDDQIKSEIKKNETTLKYKYREISEEEFNFLWELDYDERFPELKESFKYYDQIVYKQD